MNQTDLLQQIAAYVIAPRSAPLPDGAVETVVDLFVDTIGVAFAGASASGPQIVRAVAGELGGSPQSVVIGESIRTSMTNAALVNATSAHALDLDDSHHPGLLHPSAVLIPTLLAVAETRHASGPDVIEAYLYGLDLAAAIGNGVNPGHYDRGWHATCSIGTVAAAGACARLLRLTAEQAAAALSIAMSESSGIRRNFGSMTKSLHAGLAASGAVLATQLAERGFTAGSKVLEGDQGWLDLFVGPGQWDATAITDVLDHGFALAIEGLAIKPYASCGVTHPPISAAIELRERGVSADDVEELHLLVNPRAAAISSFTEPTSGLEAKFSLSHCVATGLVTGRAGIDEFTDELAADAVLTSVRRRVRIDTDPTVGLTGHMSWGCQLTAVLRNGRSVAVEIDMARGKWAGRRLTRAEVVAKSRGCFDAAGVNASAAQTCLDTIEQLPDLDDVVTLADAIVDCHSGTPGPTSR